MLTASMHSVKEVGGVEKPLWKARLDVALALDLHLFAVSR